MSTYSATKLRLALLSAAKEYVGVTDEDGSETITQWFRDIGWGFWIKERGYINVEKYAWCGVFVGAMGLKVGEYLHRGVCVDMQLNPAIAKYVLPSTVRLASNRKWKQAGYGASETGVIQYGPDIRGQFRKDPKALRGCVATVGYGVEGSHIVIIDRYDADAMTFLTVEGNATRDGFEGVVRKTRNIDEIKVLWMPRSYHFESLL